jgi:hypothetical protein
MAENTFKSYIKSRLPREDDKQLFEDLAKAYREEGKDGVSKYLKSILSKLEE